MANPPFNVNEVVYEKVKDDKRFNTYGIPKNKTKSSKKNSDKKETVPNANYLWISYFYSYLNEKGRAGFVMASSATDSSNKDKIIIKLIAMKLDSADEILDKKICSNCGALDSVKKFGEYEKYYSKKYQKIIHSK